MKSFDEPTVNVLKFEESIKDLTRTLYSIVFTQTRTGVRGIQTSFPLGRRISFEGFKILKVLRKTCNGR